MSQKTGRTPIKAVQQDGAIGTISLKKAREYEKRGRGHFEGDVFVFAPHLGVENSLSGEFPKSENGPKMAVVEFIRVRDSGMSSLGLRWPLPISRRGVGVVVA